MARVLIANASPSRGATYGRSLSASGCEVELVTTGAECLASVGKCWPDVLILDLQLAANAAGRVLDGLHTAWETQPVPAVILTGDGSSQSVTGIILTSPVVVAYLENPFQESVLEEVVRAAAAFAGRSRTIWSCRPYTDGEDRPPPRSVHDCVEVPVLVPSWQWSALEGIAQGQGLTMGQLLRRVIAGYVAELGNSRAAVECSPAVRIST